MPKSDKLNQSQQIILACYVKRHRRAPRAVFSPLAAITSKCRDCCAGSVQSVRQCDLVACALWPFRNGIREVPSELTPEQRAGLTMLASQGAAI